ncbi:Arm DNA-binding domain-containing protein [uncultured Mailhella sp.]|uniref:Arm DNA-binding domain-containing protein n=1 Tax=uncultured Mailhella sp. TaxID=1981031 RepID=UPI0032092207
MLWICPQVEMWHDIARKKIFFPMTYSRPTRACQASCRYPVPSLKSDIRPRGYFGDDLSLFIPTTEINLWGMAYRFDGQSKLPSFGEYPAVVLKDAEERREDANRMVSRGINPSDHKP